MSFFDSLPAPVRTHIGLDGMGHIGDQLDCAPCRILLLEAFRTDRCEAEGQPEQVSAFPHLVLPDTARTVDMETVARRCAYCAHPRHSELVCRPDCGCRLGTPVRWTELRSFTDHRPSYAAEESAPAFWRVRCSCGWTDTGHSRFPDIARGLAQSRALAHLMEEDR